MTAIAMAEQERRQRVTVLFIDIVGFTSLVDELDCVVVRALQRDYFSIVSEVVLAGGGVVEKYVGDAVMAVFGAPFAQEDHADRAFQAACAMHERQEALNERWRTESLPEFGLGIGLSTGEVAAALLGSEERIEYTLVGDTVNLAQRLQDLARPAGTTVLSESTHDALRVGVDAVPLQETTVKGRNAPVRAYRIDVFDNMERGLADD